MTAPQSNQLVRRVPINRTYPEGLSTYFIENVIIQHQPDHFIISFFELFIPPILGETDDERLAEVSAVDAVDAKCVVRIVVTPSRMREFLKVMNENLERFEGKFVADAETEAKE